MLTKQRLLDRGNLRREKMFIPALSGWVNIQELPASEILPLVDKLENPDTQADAVLQVISKCVVDENGVRIFNDEDIPEIKANMKTSVLLAIVKKFMEIAGLADQKKEQAN